jgi:hypothetical protein
METKHRAIDRLIWSSDIDIRVIPKRRGQVPACAGKKLTSNKQVIASNAQMITSVQHMSASYAQTFASGGLMLASNALKHASKKPIPQHEL